MSDHDDGKCETCKFIAACKTGECDHKQTFTDEEMNFIHCGLCGLRALKSKPTVFMCPMKFKAEYGTGIGLQNLKL